MGVAQGRLSLGFFWSIIVMVSMPFVLTGVGFVYFRRLMAQGNRAPGNPVPALDTEGEA